MMYLMYIMNGSHNRRAGLFEFSGSFLDLRVSACLASVDEVLDILERVVFERSAVFIMSADKES